MQETELLVHYRKFLLLALIFLVSHQIHSQVFPDEKVNTFLKSGIDNIINQDYEEAKRIFSELNNYRKDIPLGKIYLAAVEIARSYDYEIPFNHKLITEYLETAKAKSEKLITENRNNIWNWYYFAITEGYLSYYDALRGSWLPALSTGLSAVSAFEQILSMDSTFYEAYIAIGSYKFWKSQKTEFINWLPFIDDEKELGIKYLQDAIKYSGYNSHLAIHSLIWIYINQERYYNAIKVAERSLDKYPKSRIFKWGLARAYENVNSLKAISLYYEILESYPKDLKSNKINEVTLKHIIAQQYNKVGKKKEALKLCNEILKIKDYTNREYEKLEDRLDRVRDLQDDLSAN